MITSLEKLTRGQWLIPIINPTECVSCGQSKALMSFALPRSPLSTHYAQYSHPYLGGALVLSPQSCTKINIGRKHGATHPPTNACWSQWSSGNRITCLSDCSLPAERHSSDPIMVTHAETTERLWLGLPQERVCHQYYLRRRSKH